MLYTVIEISELTKISKQSIYKKLKNESIKAHVSRKDGVTYVSEEGFALIKQSLKDNHKANTDNLNNFKSKANDYTLNEEVASDKEDSTLKTDYINYLKDQLKVKDAQIESLNERFKNSQILQLKQTQSEEKIMLLTENIRQKKEFISKLFKKGI